MTAADREKPDGRRSGRGRKPSLPAETESEVLRITMTERPEDGSTRWTTRTLAARLGVGKDMIARIWRDRDLRPWKVDSFKVSSDPRFEEKLVDVVALYTDPPERAAVFCFDEKTRCQALDRTQPSLPLRPGRAGTMTHDYRRHGTTDLFAALNLATGQVVTECRPSHNRVDVLAFFKRIDRSVPRRLDVHVVLDNMSARLGPEVTTQLADPKRARWHLHFTPTSSSWLNLVERWFNEVTRRRVRRAPSAASTISSTPSARGRLSGTRTRSRSSGTPEPTTSSPRSNEAERPCHKPKPRRVTSVLRLK